MENKHIELVKKWLADKASVSSEELRANADAANAAAVYAVYADRAARAADAVDSVDSEAADYWVKRYEELTNNGSF
tara:strand:+ start:57 stop:284 length:228 start_codon:yes stop_codon:yes gene_type:complete